jgi:hypothetical protein
MLNLLQALESNLLDNLPALDKIRPISKFEELIPDNSGFDKYAICHEIATDQKYKNRKGIYETPLFLNCYANVSNGDVAVLWFISETKKVLDEADLSNADLKTYLVEYDNSSPRPEFNEKLQAWQSVIKVTVRWRKL